MRRTKLNFERSRWTRVMKWTAVGILLIGSVAARSMAQQEGQKTFSSAEEASQALITAAQSNDEKAMLDVLGPAGKEIVSSGDDAEDAQNHANFVRRYQEMHRFMKEPDGTTTLYIGPENWPVPIPLVNKGNVWYFDTAAGKQEIVYRRVGENELSTIRVCQELVAAEKEYRSAQHDTYAQKIVSTEGQHDGLYWKADNGQPQSPIGPLVAAAFVSDTANTHPMPFRGYYFRFLSPQAKNGSSGKGGGFAFVAYPVEYRSSGVMTFLVKEDGVVYEKDLGKDTEAAVKAITERASHSGWHKSDLAQEETSAEQKTQ
jgi:hypothetical protein